MFWINRAKVGTGQIILTIVLNDYENSVQHELSGYVYMYVCHSFEIAEVDGRCRSSSVQRGPQPLSFENTLNQCVIATR